MNPIIDIAISPIARNGLIEPVMTEEMFHAMTPTQLLELSLLQHEDFKKVSP